MPLHSYARYLAPLALVAFTLALFVVVTSSGSDPAPEVSEQTTEAQPAADEGGAEEDGGGERQRRGPRRYTVQPGDTPSTIAEETGVPLERIQELNPDIDAQQLAPGQRLKLR